MSALKIPLRVVNSTLRLLPSTNILRQAGWLAVAKIVQGVASIAATLAVARHLGPAEFGLLSLASAIALFVGSAASLGLEQIATRELSTADPFRHPPMLSVLRRMRVIGALLGCTVLLAITLTPNARGYGVSSLLLILCLLPFAQVGDLAEWRLIAAGRSRRVAFATALSSPLAALARLAFALTDAGVAVFTWLLVGEWALRSLLLALSSRDRNLIAPESEPILLASALPLLRDSLPLLLSGIAVFVYMRIDQFMIAALLGPREVGLYSAIVALAEVPLVLPALLLRAALPILTRQSEADPFLRDQTLTSLMRNGFYLHLVIALIAAAFAKPLVELLYGPTFAASAQALGILVLAAPFVALGVLSSSWLVLERRTGHALRRTMVGAVLNVVLNLFFIPRFGVAGAAAATLAAQVTATYLIDAFHPQTRALFHMKNRALFPRFRSGT
ncbi:oligosaccharide flippase family protein [Rhodanobacter spathiphylli]|uniref:Polysaccharide biosynthesis protein n=1 Tax=Rhodanobacter spathiphylli B39 TaxID=1163407 RepID=I4VV04_9GAMM|nr:oligosaccharide flippase family protein [Rhodanobacter spathiphylli]EIL91045.1 polysaccharide biosynthesis protein [Rhodanobacter spathiphylli B39]